MKHIRRDFRETVRNLDDILLYFHFLCASVSDPLLIVCNLDFFPIRDALKHA